MPSTARLAGPTPAPLARAKGRYRFQVILRGPSSKAITARVRAALKAARIPRAIAVQVDVDPLSLL